GAGIIALEVGNRFVFGFKPLGLQKRIQIRLGFLELLNGRRGLVHQPDFPRRVGLGAGEQDHGVIDMGLLTTEIKDMAVGLGGVENAVGAAEGLNQAVVLEVFVNV